MLKGIYPQFAMSGQTGTFTTPIHIGQTGYPQVLHKFQRAEQYYHSEDKPTQNLMRGTNRPNVKYA